jgi:hypothetical protein
VITQHTARRIVEDYLWRAFPAGSAERRMVINDEYTIERDYGWLFSYVTVEFLRTRNPDANPIGPGPILVRRDNGDAIIFPSAFFGERALAAYESDPGSFRVLSRMT